MYISPLACNRILLVFSIGLLLGLFLGIKIPMIFGVILTVISQYLLVWNNAIDLKKGWKLWLC